ncbi:MAG: hypothetical protein ABFD69_02650 [Candidatus Sumerlaeia bacterium]
MVRFLLILGIMGVFGYFGYTIVEMQRAPRPTSPVGAARIFVRAAMKNDQAGMNWICERGVAARSVVAAQEIRNLVRSESDLRWQYTKAFTGQRAISAVVADSGRLIVIEVNQHGEEFRIAAVSMPSM